MSSLEILRAEHESEIIGPKLASLLARVATATAKTYPPEYSPTGAWNDEAIEDVLQEWTEDRLLRRKDLAKLLAGARSEGALRAGLSTSLGQHLTNRRRRSAATNLYKRMRAMLREDDAFQPVGAVRGADQPWTIAVPPSTEPSTLTENELVHLAFELSDAELGVVRYGPHSMKESPILRKPALRRFLIHILAGSKGTLTAAILIEVIKRRFNLVQPENVEIEDAMDVEVSSRNVDVEAAAASVIARMGRERCDLMLIQAQHDDPIIAAEAAGVGPEVMKQALSETLALVAEHSSDAEEAREIHKAVVERMFGESE